jgi:hypothetical protein
LTTVAATRGNGARAAMITGLAASHAMINCFQPFFWAEKGAQKKSP